MSADMVPVGRLKEVRRSYSLGQLAVIPSRRTRDMSLISTRWTVDAYTFEVPLLAAPVDSVVSPQTAIMVGQLGGLGVLNLEGLWTRYEDPTPQLEMLSDRGSPTSCELLQKIYREPVKPELILRRLEEIRAAGVIVAGSLSPQATREHYETVLQAGVDLFVIRGSTVSAEHVSSCDEPLNLKEFIYRLDVPVLVGGVSTYTSALHMMRTGAAGVLVGFGGTAGSTGQTTVGIQAPMATAVSDVAAARRDYFTESGGRYVQVIADGGISTSGELINALGVGADAAMLGVPLVRALESPAAGFYWGREAYHPLLPRGRRVHVGQTAPMERIFYGPAIRADGTENLVGALRKSMALAGYQELREFQKVDMLLLPECQQCQPVGVSVS